MAYTFFKNQTATAADVRRNFQAVRLGSLLPLRGLTAFTPTTGVFNLGAATIRWDSVYLSSTLFVAGTFTIRTGTVDTMTVSSGGDLSVTTISVGESAAAAAPNTTSGFIGGYFAGTNMTWYRKRFVGQFINTTAVAPAFAHSIAAATSTIFRARAIYRTASRAYDMHVSPFVTTTIGTSTAISWDATNIYFSRNTSAADATTLTVLVDYTPSGLV